MEQQRTPRWIKGIVVVFLCAGLFWVLASVIEVVTLVVVAALLAYVFDPVVSRLEARGLNRNMATASVFAGLALGLAVLVILFFPLLVDQIKAIQTGFDEDRARAGIVSLEHWLETRLAVVGIEDLDILGTLQHFAAENLENALNYVPGVLSLVTQLVIIPFIMFFLLKDGRRIKKGFISLVPNRYFEFTLNVFHKTNVQLGNYLRGQFIASSVVGLLSIVALWLLGVDYFILIGVFAGLTNMIPYLGPVAGASVAALVSILTTGTFDTVLLIVVVFIGIQVIDNVGVQPLVLARNVELHPLLILLTLLVAAKFFNVLGLLLAVPVTAVVKVFVVETVRNLRSYHLA